MHALRSVDVLDICQVMLERAGLPVSALVHHMHGTVAAPVALAPALPAPVLVPTAAQRPVLTHVAAALAEQRRALVLQLAARADGVTGVELALALGLAAVSVWKYTADLVRDGELVERKAHGVRAFHFFAQAVDADAWVARVAQQRVADESARLAAVVRGHVKAQRAQVRAAPRAVPPVVAARRGPQRVGRPGSELVAPPRGTTSHQVAPTPEPAREVITPPGVVPQVYATPPGRFEPRAGERLSGGFSACRPGINPITGDPW